MRTLLLVLLNCAVFGAYADTGRNQGAVNNLCQNLAAACAEGDQSSCQAAKDTGCSCDKDSGTCLRGDYSEQNKQSD
jgi:hypothetical protein